MRRREHEVVDRFGNPVDDDDIVRDGERVRVPMMMRDGLSELQRAVLADADARGTSAEMRRMVDEHRAARGLVPLALDDGTVVDVEPWKASAVRAARCGLHDDGSLSLNRPGYRFAADAAGLEAKREAYEAGVREMCDAWRGPAPPAADVAEYSKRKKTRQLDPQGRLVAEYETEEEEDAATGDAGRAMDARERAYLEMCDDLSNAWKRRPPALPWDAAPAPPAGAYPLSAGEGNACTINGRPGTLQREGDWLVCEPTDRADAAPPRTMSVADAQRIKDEAYRQMVDEMVNAWKGPSR